MDEKFDLKTCVDLVLKGIEQAENHGFRIPPNSMWAHLKEQRELDHPSHS